MAAAGQLQEFNQDTWLAAAKRCYTQGLGCFFSEAAKIMMLTNAKNPPNTINISETVPSWKKTLGDLAGKAVTAILLNNFDVLLVVLLFLPFLLQTDQHKQHLKTALSNQELEFWTSMMSNHSNPVLTNKFSLLTREN